MNAQSDNGSGFEARWSQRLAPRPRTIEEVGLSEDFLGDLLSKHLAARGVQTLSELAGLLALSGPIIERVLQILRQEARVEVRSINAVGADPKFGLTERGRRDAMDAVARDGYVGPAPVPLAHYSTVVKAQSVHLCRITRTSMREAFCDVVIGDALLDQLGPALNSGRAVFLYGAPGTGKTFLAKSLAGALVGSVLVPHAIAAGDAVISVFDPLCHVKSARANDRTSLLLEQGHDPRFVLCKRPVVVTGGELTGDMLEIRRDPISRRYLPPIQLKGNNGLLLIDDLGRQRMSSDVLFNRWIVPMEEKHDYLSTDDGRHFTVPFDVVLVFSTNLNPRDLADEAILRRIGYKVGLTPISQEEYARIWMRECIERGWEVADSVLEHALRLHRRSDTPCLPCHPRDLLAMAADLAIYDESDVQIDESTLDRAWRNYFLREHARDKH